MRVIGLMSGTSVDGIDAVLAEIDESDGEIALRQVAFQTSPWDAEARSMIADLIANRATSQQICRANFALGMAFARAAQAIIAAADRSPRDVDLIGSHGQTIWHEVAEGQVHSTLQIGEAAVIAEETGITTVADFRVADVAAGGQGAPLVSIFDWLLLRPPAGTNGWRAVQNIGGIGNVTFLPPADVDALPLAFDTGPGNVLVDWAAHHATAGTRSYDEDGALAARGHVAPAWVEAWLRHPYFRQPPPKTTGRELFSHDLAQTWWQAAQSDGLSPVDFVATVTELTAASIADAYAQFAPAPIVEVVVAGGGAHNPVLMQRLAAQLRARLERDVPVLRHEDLSGAAVTVSADTKEALCFALLAWLTVHGRAGNVPACTGAGGERLLGKIAPGRNFGQLLSLLFAR